MQNDKYKIKLNINQLRVVYELIQCSTTIPVKNMQHRLLILHMIEIHKKLIPKWTYPAERTTVVFTATQAIAFYFMFNNEDFFEPLTHATMKRILTEIHRQFI